MPCSPGPGDKGSGRSTSEASLRPRSPTASGVPLKIVSDILGHAFVAITEDIYGHVSPDVSREAAAKFAAALSKRGSAANGGH
jgi:integrase